MIRLNTELRRIKKKLLEKEAVNLPARLSISTILQLNFLPLRLREIIFTQIACRIPLVNVDQFSINTSCGRKFKVGTPYKNSIARELFWLGYNGRQPETTRVFSRLVKNAKVIFDMGTNIGFYALLAGSINKSSIIYAFEPVPFLFESLVNNISINSFLNIVPVQMAITDLDGRITFYINVESDQSASTLKGFREKTQKITVPCITLDTYVEQNNIEKVDLVKIDIEGQDHRVLQGMQRILARDEPDIICEVLYGRTEAALQEILSGFSYKYYWITDDGLICRDKIVGDSQYKNVNWLFSKKAIEQDLLDK
ncbi:MAG: hypothetical protein SCARUB_02104 [Candidatus Scalindua rubra]|uniref:Methyltransferase FkbM domain-containing protein n=1 Tax=Candidatus Scalindua rubra TaxID=1872076 RepID=A0A1E3XCU6_9BACT|nr:MAG: hypothetical protein SCARUB_02104 [Candidatus Scalindua rubra]